MPDTTAPEPTPEEIDDRLDEAFADPEHPPAEDGEITALPEYTEIPDDETQLDTSVFAEHDEDTEDQA